MSPRQVVESWIEAFNHVDLEALAALYADDAIDHQVVFEPIVGSAAIRVMRREGMFRRRQGLEPRP